MIERPILFSASMVRAILSGAKTQTRRVVKLDAEDVATMLRLPRLAACCPYGQPGDRLWVRENGWERPARSARDMREGADTWPPYEYDAEPVCCWEDGELKRLGWKRRPSIHMPRWASRILLEITSVRVERLQDISEADSIAEGVERIPSRPDRWFAYGTGDPNLFSETARGSFLSLWASLNGHKSELRNPWVWAVEFKRLP